MDKDELARRDSTPADFETRHPGSTPFQQGNLWYCRMLWPGGFAILGGSSTIRDLLTQADEFLASELTTLDRTQLSGMSGAIIDYSADDGSMSL
jgi:hypothetical protein